MVNLLIWKVKCILILSGSMSKSHKCDGFLLKQEIGKMLSIFFGYDENAVLSVDTYFNNTYDEAWLDDPFVRKIIRTVDGSEVQDRQCILSDVLGQIPPERLSGGTKALILMYEEEGFYTDLIVCGANCEDLILDMAQKKDISCSLSGYDISFENLGDSEHSVPIRCENDGSMMKTHDEFVLKMLEYAGGLRT